MTTRSYRTMNVVLSSKVIHHLILIQDISEPQDKQKGQSGSYLPRMSTYNYQRDIQEPETYI